MGRGTRLTNIQDVFALLHSSLICISPDLQLFRVLHRLHIPHCKLEKHFAGIAENCLRRIHSYMFRTCLQPEDIWAEGFNTLLNVCGTVINLNFLSAIFVVVLELLNTPQRCKSQITKQLVGVTYTSWSVTDHPLEQD